MPSPWHLIPSSAHRCVTPAQLADDVHQEYIANLTPDAYNQLFADACALANTLYHAIDTHCEQHGALEFGTIIEAVLLIRARLETEVVQAAAEDDEEEDGFDTSTLQPSDFDA